MYLILEKCIQSPLFALDSVEKKDGVAGILLRCKTQMVGTFSPLFLLHYCWPMVDSQLLQVVVAQT